ncbi:MAG: 3-hydroxyacyl-ACP dehydratase FabZ [Acidobacteria bacterium]|nr:MAG: 3-hydroxyacyl-ACP dehydratase FabZ [Acidobacteriota bacterium]
MTDPAPQQTIQSFESIIQRALPHRYPFLLVDRVTGFTPGVEIHGIKNFTANEAILLGHSPAFPVVPPGILLEAVTQLGAILVLERPEMAGKIAMILQIPSASISRIVVPGETVRFEARVLKLRETLGELRGSAYVKSELIAEGQMRFAIADRAAILNE